MVGVPIYYPEQPEASIASYNYTDIAEGTGIIKFYGFTTKDNDSVLTYALSTQAFNSDTGNLTNADGETTGHAESKSEANDGTGTYKAYTAINFNLSPFNTPRVIRGKGYLNCSVAIKETDASSAKGYWKFKIQKVSGTEVTDIAEGNSMEVYTVPAEYPNKDIFSCCILLSCTQTHFKIGDILRLSCIPYMKWMAGGYNSFMHLPHQPLDTATINFNATDFQTKLELYVPFKLIL